MLDPKLAAHDYCYVRTTGRVTGKPHEIEIWFAADDAPSGAARGTVFILAGAGHDADWVKNAKKQPRLPVRIGRKRFRGAFRVVSGKREDARARRLLLEKYAGADDGLDEWGRTALPIAIDLEA
jgi:deazaflavin-dependent oxidoreductase (nitroreductase family)